MPAALPASSGYTYAVELSVDEAVAAGAKGVHFSKPIITYVDNFLEFTTGTNVPVGYYDREKAQWIPSDDGRVIEVLSITNGMVALDIDGSGNPAEATKLAALGISDEERVELAKLYGPGAKLWRVTVTHFTPWDCNWPYTPPDDAEPPPDQDDDDQDEDDPDCQGGSIIECQNGVLGESIPVAGSSLNINYRTSRLNIPRQQTKHIVISRDTIPASLIDIEATVEVGGRAFRKTFPAIPNQSWDFSWDGKDAYGRSVSGAVVMKLTLGYRYVAQYRTPSLSADSEFQRSFNRPSLAAVDGFGLERSRGTIVLRRVTEFPWGKAPIGVWNARGAGLGGYTLDVHHTYDWSSHTLWRGDGTKRSGAELQQFAFLKNLNVPGGAHDIAFGADGTMYGTSSGTKVYVADPGIAGGVIWRKKPGEQQIEVIAGADNPNYLNDGDGGPAIDAHFDLPRFLAIGPDESIYVTGRGFSIRRIRPDGIVERFAGTGDGSGELIEGGSALDAHVLDPSGIAIAGDGTVYFVEPFTSKPGVRSITTDGRIHYIHTFTDANDVGNLYYGGIRHPLRLDAENNLYLANNKLLRIRPTGAIDVLADGTQYWGNGARSAAVAKDGRLWITQIPESGPGFLCERRPDGKRARLAPVFEDGPYGPYSYPLGEANVSLGFDGQMYVMPDGLSDSYGHAPVFELSPSTTFTNGELTLPSDDGEELYVFDIEGRHIKTLSKTGLELWKFSYDATGRVSEIVDRNGQKTTITHDAVGNPIEIVAPGGQKTALTVDANGYLAKATYPGGESFQMTYSEQGLLTQLVDRRGGVHTFEYDETGRLTKDVDGLGYAKTIVATRDDARQDVVVTAPSGQKTTYTTITDTLTDVPMTRVRRTTGPGGDSAAKSVLPAVSPALTAPDGTKIEAHFDADTRFGMHVPLASTVTYTTPGGKTIATTRSRKVTLSTPGEPTSVSKIVETSTTNGKSTSTTYDVNARTITTASAVGRTSQVTLDEKERPVSIRPHIGVITEPVQIAYDARGYMVSMMQGLISETTEYDANGRPVTTTDALGRQIQRSFDLSDRVRHVTLPSGRAYGMTYDAAGALVGVTMPSGKTHALTHDLRGLGTSYTPPSGGGAGKFLTIDGDQRVTAVTDGSRALAYSYDVGSRLIGTTYEHAVLTNVYAAMTGVLTSATLSPTGQNGQQAQSLTWAYDGSLITALATSGDAVANFEFTYNSDFAIASVKLDANPARVLAHDNDGLLTSDGPFSIQREGPLGAATAISDANAAFARTYDGLGRESTWALTVGGMQRYSANLIYDVAGQPVMKLETISGKQLEFEYGYDIDGQLASVKRTDVAAGASSCEVFGYDVNGNLTSVKIGTCGAEETTMAATYDQDDRLVTRGNVVYEFDDAGYMTTRGIDQFVYGARGELFEATLNADLTTEKVIRYSYDAMGRLTARTDASGSTQYLYAGSGYAVTHSRSADGTLSEYFYDDAGRLYGVVRGGTRYYVATDTVGSPRLVVASNGDVVMEVEYSPFGRVVSGDPSTFELPVGFAGGIPDVATKLVRMGHRDYEPIAGRFTVRDPVLFDGGQFNLYAYANNDPILRSDRSGLASGICNALQQIADRERRLGGPDAYAKDVLPFALGMPNDGTVHIGKDGKPLPAGTPRGETFGGIDFNYFEAGFAASRRVGPNFALAGLSTYTTIATSLHWLRGMAWADARKNFNENIAGTRLGIDASFWPSVDSYRKTFCDDCTR
ncbi:MAG TPA: RHS repeat-associated core domain-containing protein [Polyangium sp.]|nr:RHS repeat-associated core domain-containing protein [Polyangium sp.]